MAENEESIIPLQKNGITSEPNKLGNLLALLETCTFEFSYKGRHRVEKAAILARSLEEAKSRAMKYCAKYRLRFISIAPFYMDLTKLPEEKLNGTVEQET